jgi:hypothetical protein
VLILCRRLRVVGFVDPHRAGERWRFGVLADEAFRVRLEGGGQDVGAGGADEFGAPVVHVGGHVQAYAGMAMIMVVPAEEPVAEHPRVLDAAEAVGEVRPVLQGLELRLGVGVVVRAVRPGVALGHAQVGEQERHRLGGHRAAAVGVDGQLVLA